jgi:hypothetical protein
MPAAWPVRHVDGRLAASAGCCLGQVARVRTVLAMSSLSAAGQDPAYAASLVKRLRLTDSNPVSEAAVVEEFYRRIGLSDLLQPADAN